MSRGVTWLCQGIDDDGEAVNKDGFMLQIYASKERNAKHDIVLREKINLMKKMREKRGVGSV